MDLLPTDAVFEPQQLLRGIVAITMMMIAVTPTFSAEMVITAKGATPLGARRAAAEMGSFHMRKPENFGELLRNIKSAAETGLLLHDAFYDEANLRIFLSTSQITRVGNGPGSFLSLTALDDRPANDHHQVYIYPASRRDDLGRADESEKLRAGVTLTGRAFFSVSLLEEVFGKATEVTDFPPKDPTPHPIPVGKKTHELGNTAISYRFLQTTSESVVTAIINSDGTVNRLNTNAREK